MALNQNIPLFFRLYIKLKHAIITGDIKRGSKLETLEGLSQQFGLSQASIRKSLDLLEREGLLIRKQGWGTIVPEDLKIFFFDLGRLIQSKKTFDEMSKADIQIIDSGWVKPNLQVLTNLQQDARDLDQVFKINSQITFSRKLYFKTLINLYFTSQWLERNSISDATPPRDILLCMSQWLISNPIFMKEVILPSICTDKDAECLGLPDGTPVFHQSVVIKDENHNRCFHWDGVSTANLFSREVKNFP